MSYDIGRTCGRTRMNPEYLRELVCVVALGKPGNLGTPAELCLQGSRSGLGRGRLGGGARRGRRARAGEDEHRRGRQQAESGGDDIGQVEAVGERPVYHLTCDRLGGLEGGWLADLRCLVVV
jgi:hypothetical protein